MTARRLGANSRQQVSNFKNPSLSILKLPSLHCVIDEFGADARFPFMAV
ncbi:hypothetical protein CSIRO_2810 [Bradyrhizobiaceae bacterium SG-6C]|nr:hypothetical protein CSIRO_2810 [Bradyrhizobiaceae bacterium SG-6C]